MNHPPLRVVIDEAGFRRLLAGDPLLTQSTAGLRVEVMLSEYLDWARMLRAVVERVAPLERPPPDPPEAREFLPRRKNRR